MNNKYIKTIINLWLKLFSTIVPYVLFSTYLEKKQINRAINLAAGWFIFCNGFFTVVENPQIFSITRTAHNIKYYRGSLLLYIFEN
jgi:CRISPR/Cas system-associated protein Csx1